MNRLGYSVSDGYHPVGETIVVTKDNHYHVQLPLETIEKATLEHLKEYVEREFEELENKTK